MRSRHSRPPPLAIALGLSLALHLAVLQAVGLPLPSEVSPERVLEVRLRTPPPLPATPSRSQTARSPRQAIAPAQGPTPRLGGGVMSDGELVASAIQSAAVGATGRLATAAAMQRIDNLPVAEAGKAGLGETTSSTSPFTRPSDALRQVSAARAATFAPQRGGDGGGVSQGDTTAEGRQDAAASPRATALASASPANGMPAAIDAAPPEDSALMEVAGQRVDLLHARTAPAELAARSATALGAELAPHRGGEPALAGPVERHRGAKDKGASLHVAVAAPVDVSALPGLSGRLATAALTADGRACFQYTPSLRSERREGWVVLRVQVGHDGRAQAVAIKQSSGDLELDATALAQARNCARFSLLDRYGRPVSATIELPIQYRMIDER